MDPTLSLWSKFVSDHGRTIGLTLLAFIAGLLGHLMRTVERNGRVEWHIAALEASASAFVGYLTIQVCDALGLPNEWTGVIVGLFGWLGASTSVKILEQIIRKRLGIDK